MVYCSGQTMQKELEKNLNQLNNIGNKFGLIIDLEKTVIQKLTQTQM